MVSLRCTTGQATTPALLQRYPQLEDLPRLPLGEWPTPVTRLSNLGSLLGAELWAKRDDLSAPVFGGNKVRKLEFLLGSAVAGGAASLVTVGGIGSNHVVATGLYGRQLGLPTAAVVVPQPVTPLVRTNAELARALEVTLVPCPNRALVPLYLGRALLRAKRPMLVGPGGSSPLGTLGYVSAALELAQQIQQKQLPEPDDIFVALGSGGSMAGLVLGCALAGLRSRVVGVRVVERLLANQTLVRALVSRTAALLGQHGVAVPSPGPGAAGHAVLHRHFGDRYGRPTAAARAALQITAENEGLLLETTYTAKTMAALIDHCRGAGAGRRLLFWNTFNSRDLSPLLRTPTPPPLPPRIHAWLEAPDEGEPG